MCQVIMNHVGILQVGIGLAAAYLGLSRYRYRDRFVEEYSAFERKNDFRIISSRNPNDSRIGSIKRIGSSTGTLNDWQNKKFRWWLYDKFYLKEHERKIVRLMLGSSIIILGLVYIVWFFEFCPATGAMNRTIFSLSLLSFLIPCCAAFLGKWCFRGGLSCIINNYKSLAEEYLHKKRETGDDNINLTLESLIRLSEENRRPKP
jgi:hypothetical protein